MNERIQQLLLQVVPRAGEDGEYLPSLHTSEDIEKFAELIVRQCAQVASDYEGAHYVGTAIEKHFGVEE